MRPPAKRLDLFVAVSMCVVVRRMFLLCVTAVALWLGLGATAAAADPCVAQVVVEGHGVPAHVVTEMQASADRSMARAMERTGSTICAPVAVALLPGIEGAIHLDPPWVLPSWAAGAAVPTERRIVIAITADGRRQDRERVLLHELAHVAARDAAAGTRLPRWLDEGIARVVAGEHGPEDLSVLARARVGDRLIPFAALEESFPGRADQAALAYAQSGRAVSLLEGEGALPDVLAGIARGLSVDDALAETIGRRSWQLERDVARSIPLWRAWAVVGFETDLALGAAALVCVWAGLRARRRFRDGLARLEDAPATGSFRTSMPPLNVSLVRWTTPLQGGTSG